MSTFTPVQNYLLNQHTETYTRYYNGYMSYKLQSKDWSSYVSKTFDDVKNLQTSENIFKLVVDLYAENLMPQHDALVGFKDSLIPLLCTGEAIAIVNNAGEIIFPEHYEVITDGQFVSYLVFTRSLSAMKDYMLFGDSSGEISLWSKDIDEDLSFSDRSGYTFEETSTAQVFYFNLKDKGFGATLASLQDRINHSIIDQTVVAEMYARPFWYLLNTELPVVNPYLPTTPQMDAPTMREQKMKGSAGRIFTTSSPGPFGQLTPPTISDMISYHDSLLDKVGQVSGIPQYYFKPGSSTPPTGIALKVMSNRFNNKVMSLRQDIAGTLVSVLDAVGIHVEKDALWGDTTDLLQDVLDSHGLALSQMGYPFKYIASVVTPNVNTDDYVDDGILDSLTLKQVENYAQNPGQSPVDKSQTREAPDGNSTN